MSGKKVQDILDNCIERMLKGESIEDCLKTYPEQAHELEPLLRTSAGIRQNSLAIQPASELKQRVRTRLQGMIYAKTERKRAKVPIWHRRWAVSLVSVLVVFIASAGTVAASGKALPDQLLYPVKLASEEIRLELTFSDLDKAELHINFTQRRAAEMAEVARQGKDDTALLLAEKVASQVDQLEETLGVEKTPQDKSPKVLAPSLLPTPFISEGIEDYGGVRNAEDSELATMLSESRAGNLDKLQAALDKAPEELKPSLEQAIENVSRDYDTTIFIIESGPSP